MIKSEFLPMSLWKPPKLDEERLYCFATDFCLARAVVAHEELFFNCVISAIEEFLGVSSCCLSARFDGAEAGQLVIPMLSFYDKDSISVGEEVIRSQWHLEADCSIRNWRPATFQKPQRHRMYEHKFSGPCLSS